MYPDAFLPASEGELGGLSSLVQEARQIIRRSEGGPMSAGLQIPISQISRYTLGKKDFGIPQVDSSPLRRGKIRTGLIGSSLLGGNKYASGSSLLGGNKYGSGSSLLGGNKYASSSSLLGGNKYASKMSALRNRFASKDPGSLKGKAVPSNGLPRSNMGSSLLAGSRLGSKYIYQNNNDGNSRTDDTYSNNNGYPYQEGEELYDELEQDGKNKADKFSTDSDNIYSSDKILSRPIGINDQDGNAEKEYKGDSLNDFDGGYQDMTMTKGGNSEGLSLSIDAPMNALRRALLFQSALLKQRNQMSRARQNHQFLQTIG